MFREVKAEMVRHDLTAAQLAEAIGISKAAFSLKMKGEREWKRREMMKIRDILAPEKTMDELFHVEGEA
mgnify:CR=1 FL=1